MDMAEIWNSHYQRAAIETLIMGFCLLVIGRVIGLRCQLAHSLPPGPSGHPFIGHALKVPVNYQWKVFAKWSKQYGDLFYVHVFGRPMIICNSFDTAKELMEKRSSNYSDRPPLLAAELLGWGSLIVVLRYGERWKKQRRILQKSFDQQTSKSFQADTISELKKFVKSISGFEGDPSKNIHRFVTGTLSLAAYGHEVTTTDDRLVADMDEVSRITIETGSPGATPVDFFPLLQYFPTWLPGMGFLKFLREGRLLAEKTFKTPVDLVRKDRETGVARRSFISDLLEDYEGKRTRNAEHEEDIAAMGAILFIGGAETTEFTLYTFILMMVLHPEVADRARVELDEFVQAEKRLPSFGDRNHISFVDCIIKEVYRINPAFPLCIPHRCMEQDTLGSWTIPAGSMIVPNLWQMMRDERYYPDPDRFLPERFADVSKNKYLPHPADPASDPSKIVFGFGRRVCPGQFFAEDVIWITVATILWTYEILPDIDSTTGNPILPAMEFTSGPMTTVKPFACRLVPRNEKHMGLINEL